MFVSPDARLQRATLQEEGRFAWAAGFPVVLEKHGHVTQERVGPEAMSDPDLWAAGVPVVVARLPEAVWTPEVVAMVVGARSTVLVEGPPPAALARWLGLTVEPLGPYGSLLATEPGLQRAGARYGPMGGAVAAPSTREVPRERELDWNQLTEVPIDAAQARAWHATGWDVASLQGASAGATLAQWLPAEAPGDRVPAFVQYRNLIVSALGLLAFLAQAHSAEPADGIEFRTWPRTLGLEAIALGLIDRLYELAGVSRARVMPWPAGRTWALTVRHDVDRRPTSAEVETALAMHEAAGTSATWYWRASTLADEPRERRWNWHPRRARRVSGRTGSTVEEAMRVVAAHPRHEVALHTERPWGAAAEREAVRRVSGRPVRGTSAHGDPLMFRWQGAPNVLWAEYLECDYTELIQQAHLHPHRFLAPDHAGRLSAPRVLCLPHHESFDRSTRPGDVAAEEIVKSALPFAESGGLMQVLNHPDINLDALGRTLARLPTDGRLDCTAAEAADWWRRTHVAGELNVRADRAGWSVFSRRGVRDVVLEVLRPGAETQIKLVSLAPRQHALVEDAP